MNGIHDDPIPSAAKSGESPSGAAFRQHAGLHAGVGIGPQSFGNRRYSAAGASHVHLDDQSRTSQILMDLPDVVKHDPTNFAFLFKMSDEYSRLQATIKELLVASAGLDDDDDDLYGDFGQFGSTAWQSMDSFGDPVATRDLANSMAERQLRFQDVVMLVRNQFAMLLSAAPVDHRFAKFLLAWSLMYLLFGTFYTTPLSTVYPLIVELSIHEEDSARVFEGMFQRLGSHFLILAGAIIANWFVFWGAMNHIQTFRSVELLSSRHKKWSTVGKIVAQCSAIAASSIVHGLWQTVCVYFLGMWWSFVGLFAQPYMLLGFFLALVTLHTALQSLLLLISVAADPKRVLSIYLWCCIPALILCGFSQGSIFVPYYFVPFYYLNFMNYAFQALLFSDPMMKFDQGAPYTVLFSFAVFVWSAFFLSIASYLTVKYDQRVLSPVATSEASREIVQQQAIESQKEAQTHATARKKLQDGGQDPGDSVQRSFWSRASGSLSSFGDTLALDVGGMGLVGSGYEAMRTPILRNDATPRRSSIVNQAASLSKASRHAFQQRQQGLLPRALAQKNSTLSISDFLDGLYSHHLFAIDAFMMFYSASLTMLVVFRRSPYHV